MVGEIFEPVFEETKCTSEVLKGDPNAIGSGRRRALEGANGAVPVLGREIGVQRRICVDSSRKAQSRNWGYEDIATNKDCATTAQRLGTPEMRVLLGFYP